MSGRHLGMAAASACTAMLVFPGVGAATLAAPAASAAPAATITARQASNTAPYLVQCLDGGQGMAIWSDNTTGFTEWCRNGYGGTPREPQDRGNNRGGGPARPNLPLGPDLPANPDIPIAP